MKRHIIIPFIIAALSLMMAATAAAQDTAYLSPDYVVQKGKAPGMTWKLLSDKNGVKEYAIVFTQGDEVLSGISDFATQQHIVAARFTAIGALKKVTFAWLDPARTQYKLKTLHQQVELVSLIGDIAEFKGNPVVHTHVGLGLSDGSMQGGHLIEGVTYPTVELFMTAFPTPLQKDVDKATGLKLIFPELK